MGWLSSLAPILGTGIGALLAAPTGGMSLGMGALIGGVAGSGVSSALAASEAVDAQKDANSQNIAFQKQVNDTQIELANTAHQREMADLEKAGLNPILSAKYGGSATPGLTAPSMTSLAFLIQSSAEQSRATMLSTQNLMADLAVKRATVLATSAQAVKNAAEAQSVLNENDLFDFTREPRMKGASNKAWGDLLEYRNRAKDEMLRANRPDWLRSIGVGYNDIIRSQRGSN